MQKQRVPTKSSRGKAGSGFLTLLSSFFPPFFLIGQRWLGLAESHEACAGLRDLAGERGYRALRSAAHRTELVALFIVTMHALLPSKDTRAVVPEPMQIELPALLRDHVRVSKDSRVRTPGTY